MDLSVMIISALIYIKDVDKHCAIAKAAGATIVLEPADTSYGSRGDSAQDPEGHYRTFGTYRPGGYWE